MMQEIAIKSPKLTFNSAQRSDLRLISFTSAIAQEGWYLILRISSRNKWDSV
jgi:hypothetical protein